MSQILLVEDEPTLADVVATTLRAAKLEVRWAADLAAAEAALEEAAFDLMLLDLRLPDGDGRALLARRAGGLPPVIVLSALGEEHDVVEALDAGARDYIQKPFRSAELLARIQAALRDAPKRQDVEVEFDTATRQIRVGRNRIHLSKLEGRLVEALMKAPDQSIDYDSLIEAVWDGKGRGHTALRVLVGQLRQKIEPEPDRPRIILADRGVGYRYNREARIDA